MIDAALIVAGIVVQVWRDTLPASIPAPDEGEIVAFAATDGVICGMLWDGNALTTPAPPEPGLPDEVPMWKVQRVLILQGMDQTVADYLAALPGTEGKIARSDWDRAPNFVVAGPFALAAKVGLSLSDEQWSDLILAANAIA